MENNWTLTPPGEKGYLDAWQVGDHTITKTEETAKLIAASKEILEACERLADGIEPILGYLDSCGRGYMRDRVEKARKAIAKTRGGQ